MIAVSPGLETLVLDDASDSLPYHCYPPKEWFATPYPRLTSLTLWSFYLPLNQILSVLSQTPSLRHFLTRHDRGISMGRVDRNQTALSQQVRILHKLPWRPAKGRHDDVDVEPNDCTIPHAVLDCGKAMVGHFQLLSIEPSRRDVHLPDLHSALLSHPWPGYGNHLQLRERRSNFNGVGVSERAACGSIQNSRLWTSNSVNFITLRYFSLESPDKRSTVSTETFLTSDRSLQSDETFASLWLLGLIPLHRIWLLDHLAPTNI